MTRRPPAPAQECDMTGLVEEKGKVVRMERTLGRVGFVCVFQEVSTFQLKLSNFQAHIHREVLDSLLAEATGQDKSPPAAGEQAGAGEKTGAGEKDADEGNLYFLRATFDLNKATRNVAQRFSMHRVSNWDRQEVLRAWPTRQRCYSLSSSLAVRCLSPALTRPPLGPAVVASGRQGGDPDSAGHQAHEPAGHSPHPGRCGAEPEREGSHRPQAGVHLPGAPERHCRVWVHSDAGGPARAVAPHPQHA